MTNKKLVHIDLFYQPSDDGIPSHYVVQFKHDVDKFMSTECFSDFDDALEFKEKLIASHIYSVDWDGE